MNCNARLILLYQKAWGPTMCHSRIAAPRKSIGGGIFLIGLAILFATDWFWPGILVLIGVTSLAEVFLRRMTPGDIPLRVDVPARLRVQPELVRYPAKCPHCGAPVPEPLQEGTRKRGAACAYCGATLEPV